MSRDEEERGGIPGLYTDLSLRLCARGHTTPHTSPVVYWQHIGALITLILTLQNRDVHSLRC